MYRLILLLILGLGGSCRSTLSLSMPPRAKEALTGAQFYQKVIPLGWQEREALAVNEVLEGNIPAFGRQLVRIQTTATDSLGKMHRAEYYVSPDYLGIGSNKDFARIPLTPMAAQRIADALGCFLPTRKMVDDIYRQAKIKLEPLPLTQARDSAATFYQHHLAIERQRGKRRGLIAGIKKDVVISSKVALDPRPHRVAIYGWHQLNGKPIQPLYTGHVDWYVDYSHGIRLVYRLLKVDGKWMDYREVLANPLLKALLCDEALGNFYRYPATGG